MPISLTCNECGKRLKARDELAGKLLPCPNCGRKVLVPEPDENIANYLLQEEPEAPSPPLPVSSSPPSGDMKKSSCVASRRERRRKHARWNHCRR
jgi:DNA-directed RNA polymerase subunit RPC12/RpoP